MTAAVESLHRQYPGEYRLSVDTTCPSIWDHNPHVERLPADQCHTIEMHYPLVHQSHMVRVGHFMMAFTTYLGEQIGRPLSLQVNRPALYLSDQEKAAQVVALDRPYLVINGGTKTDYTNKRWGTKNYQKVVDALKDRVAFVQIGEGHHDHRPLAGAVNMIGRTKKPRELFRLCCHSIGGLGPTTFLQHIMAALGKFYCCIVGGREPLSWLWYPTQTTFSTQGQLPCCTPSACWKSRVVPLGDGDKKDQSLCSLPVINAGGETVPACMEAVRPEAVIHAIETYLRHRK